MGAALKREREEVGGAAKSRSLAWRCRLRQVVGWCEGQADGRANHTDPRLHVAAALALALAPNAAVVRRVGRCDARHGRRRVARVQLEKGAACHAHANQSPGWRGVIGAGATALARARANTQVPRAAVASGAKVRTSTVAGACPTGLRAGQWPMPWVETR